MKRAAIAMGAVVLAGVITGLVVFAQQTPAGAGGAAGGTGIAGLPPGEAQAKARLDKSNRHAEYVKIDVPDSKVPLNTFVVYPERKDKAPVVIVVMEIYGLSDWLRGTCDQLAADGFIAIAPDFISGKGPKGGGTEDFASRSDVTRAVSGLKPAEVMADINAARIYGLKLPSANGKTATVGFCWGGGMSFSYATVQPDLNAAVVFYGTPPADDQLAKIKCPVMGFYGGNDNRISSTVPATEATMKKLEKSYTAHIYDGAGHGFARAQDQAANLKAIEQAWPLAIQFLTENTK